MLWKVLDEQRRVLIVLDDEDWRCKASPPCGGCDSCLLIQAAYTGCVMEPAPSDTRADLCDLVDLEEP